MDGLIRRLLPSAMQAIGAVLIMGSMLISQRVDRPSIARAEQGGRAS